MKIAAGTTSELKIRAIHSALSKAGIDADIIPVKTSSGIPDQPFGIEQISEGARNRAANSLEQSGADIGLGIESGLIQDDVLNRWLEIAVAVTCNQDGPLSLAYSTAYPIPDWAVDDVRKNNSEMGTFIREIDPGAEKDPLKYFSTGAISREEILTEAIACALIELINKDKFKQPEGL